MANRKDNFVTPQDCGRKDDLMDYLYGESDQSALAPFERHLNECDSCRAELNAFGRLRDDLSAWQVGFAPRTEVVLQRRRLDVLRELIAMFPAWVRGAALTGAAAAIVVVALSIANANISVKNGGFALSFGTPEIVTGTPSSGEIEKAIRTALAHEREKMQDEYHAQMTDFKDQLAAEYKAQLRAVNTEQQAKFQAVKASLRSEIARVNRQNQNIRPFFDSDEYADLWSTGR